MNIKHSQPSTKAHYQSQRNEPADIRSYITPPVAWLEVSLNLHPVNEKKILAINAKEVTLKSGGIRAPKPNAGNILSLHGSESGQEIRGSKN